MRAFVTGATGFIGASVVEDLLDHGHELAVLMRATTDPWRLHDLLGRVTAIRGDFDDMDGMCAALEAFAPQAVLHLGWRGVASIERNTLQQAGNIADTLHLMAHCAAVGAGVFIGTGSQAEYGPQSEIITEMTPCRPTSLYGMAKLAAGQMAAHLACSLNVRFAWLRVFSLYGPRDADHWVIPRTITTLRRGERMSLTQCEQRWGFLHVRDAAAAFRHVLEAKTASGVFNLGSAEAPPLRDTMTRLRDLVDPAATLGFGEVPYHPDQVMLLQADISRLSALGWRPAVVFDDGLAEMVRWYAAAR